MKKYTVTLFLFVFITSSSYTLANPEILSHTQAVTDTTSPTESLPAPESTPEFSAGLNSKPATQTAPRLQLDDSLYSDDEYALIAAVPATQKPAWQRHYEYVGARILSAFLAIHKYASESYGSLKRFILRHIMRRQLEVKRVQKQQVIQAQV